MRSAAGENGHTRNARLASGTVYVAAVMKQERPYIIEWVAWHRLLGFEIMIADNGGSDGQTELLRRLDDAGLITYLDVRHFRRYPQPLAYYAMFRRALKARVAYLGFLDADEFFEPLSANIEQGVGAALIKQLFRVTNAPAVAFNWMCFGSSNRRDTSPEPVLERFSHSAPVDFMINYNFKTFCDVTQVAQLLGRGLFGDLVMHPHGIKTRASLYSHDGFEMTFNQREFGLSECVSWRNARIRHYVVKSLSEYCDIKTRRGCADMRSMYSESHFQVLDRNDVHTPMDPGALALLGEAMHDIENRLISTRPLPRASGRLFQALRVSWDARPPLRLLLRKLR